MAMLNTNYNSRINSVTYTRTIESDISNEIANKTWLVGGFP